MATNQTENYDLNQWLSTDQVLRTDFNTDNAKLDASLAEKAEADDLAAAVNRIDALESSKASQSALDSLAAAVPKFAVGTYIGDDTTDRIISLPFSPKAVFLCSQNGATYTDGSNLSHHVYGGLAMIGFPVLDTRNNPAITLRDNGFLVTELNYAHTNQGEMVYHYFAFG